jgi:hypothetical protein
MSYEDSLAAAGSAGESDHTERALRLVVGDRRHEPAAALTMIDFTREGNPRAWSAGPAARMLRCGTLRNAP